MLFTIAGLVLIGGRASGGEQRTQRRTILISLFLPVALAFHSHRTGSHNETYLQQCSCTYQAIPAHAQQDTRIANTADSHRTNHRPATIDRQQTTQREATKQQNTRRQKHCHMAVARLRVKRIKKKMLKSDLTKKLVKLIGLFSAGRSWEFVGSCAKAPKADLKLTQQAGLFIQKLRQGTEDRLLLL
jgi:hypothetical protein